MSNGAERDDRAPGHLIHIGYPKTGSTFLQRWFRDNPQLRFAAEGLGGFRSVGHIVRDGATGEKPPRYRVTSEEGLSMPGLGPLIPPPAGLEAAQAGVCSMLGEMFPEARILLVTRGFRSMTYSLYAEFVRRGLALGIEEYCRKAPQIVGGDLMNFDRLIALYEHRFGAANLMVLPYELLRDDPARFVRELESWLGIEPFPPGPDRANPALSPAEVYWYPRLERVARRLSGGRGLARRIPTNRGKILPTPRLRWAVRWLARLRPGRGVGPECVPDAYVEACRGKAERLRANPLYRPYAGDYLL